MSFITQTIRRTHASGLLSAALLSSGFLSPSGRKSMVWRGQLRADPLISVICQR